MPNLQPLEHAVERHRRLLDPSSGELSLGNASGGRPQFVGGMRTRSADSAIFVLHVAWWTLRRRPLADLFYDDGGADHGHVKSPESHGLADFEPVKLGFLGQPLESGDAMGAVHVTNALHLL